MQLLYTKRKCRNHGFLLAFFGDFLSLLKESHPSETEKRTTAGNSGPAEIRSLYKKERLVGNCPPGTKAGREGMPPEGGTVGRQFVRK